MKKKPYIIWVILITVLVLAGCGQVDDDDIPTSPTTVNSDLPVSYIINDTSSIEDDFELFGIELTPSSDELALMDICALFPDNSRFYIYFRMPEDDAYDVFRADTITINGRTFPLDLLEVNGSYQKYVIDPCPCEPNGEYEVTKIHLINEKKPEGSQTYTTDQLCIATINDESFYFSQEYRKHITLAGTLFESVYQFNKENNVFQDMWYHIVSDTGGLDEDKRSFFYFAFNCYDVDRDEGFTPDDILELDVAYRQLSYIYSGKDKKAAENISPLAAKKEQTIKPDRVAIASDDKRSNKKMYVYNTINKLCDADFSQNCDESNANTLDLAARSYDWTVQFGNREGYVNRKLDAGILWWETHDIDYTEIEDFQTIRIKYRYDGKTFNLKTSSLVVDKTTTEQEPVPSKEPNFAQRLKDALANDSMSLADKIKYVFQLEQLVTKIIVICLLALVLYIVFRVLLKKGKIKVKGLPRKIRAAIKERTKELKEDIKDAVDIDGKDDDK